MKFNPQEMFSKSFQNLRRDFGVHEASARSRELVINRFFEEMYSTSNPFKKINLIIELLRFKENHK